MFPFKHKWLLAIISSLISLGINTSLSTNVDMPYKSIEEKTEHCRKLVKELAQVSGLKSIDIPKVEVVSILPNQNLAIAMYLNNPSTISIHEWTYDMCMDPEHTLMGKDSLNALVFILSHELAHVIKKHTDRHVYEKAVSIDSNEISMSFMPQSINQSSSIRRNALDSIIRIYRGLSKQYMVRRNEAEADLHAGFMAYMAGYETRKAGAEFLEHAYEQFELNTDKGQYVSLEERKTIIEETGKTVDTLIQVFEMANLLTIAGEYEIATNCYQFINSKYFSPALLNNVGLSIILESISFLDKNFLKYSLPLSINTSLKIEKPSGFLEDHILQFPSSGVPPIMSSGLEDDKYDDLILKLKQAIAYFDMIQTAYPYYYEAYLNESIACLLIQMIENQEIIILSERERENHLLYALAALHKARKAIYSTSYSLNAESNINMMFSILYHYSGDSTQAVKYFEQAKRTNSHNSLVAANEPIIKNQLFPVANENQELPPAICLEEEKVNSNTSISKAVKNIRSWDLSLYLGSYESHFIIFQTKSTSTGKLYHINVTKDWDQQKNYSVFKTNDNYEYQSACQIALLDSITQVEAVYGLPGNILQTSSGSYYKYTHEPIIHDNTQVIDGIVFYSQNSSLVNHWFIFEKSDPYFQ